MPRVRRRDFLKLVGAGGAGVGAGMLLGRSKQRPVELLLPQPQMPEAYSPGIATWFNTVCRRCPAGCGITVRVREGRAKKIEGNPLHPVSQGKSCALGQADLNVLYHPDRLVRPLLRNGGETAGGFSEAGWDEALAHVAGRLSGMRESGSADRVHLLTGRVRGHLDLLFERFMQAIGSGNYRQYEFDHPGSLYAANKRCFDIDRLPYYDFGNTDFLLSFGADPLDAWLSPVHYGLGYGQMRQGRPGRRGRFVQVEPRMSLSGANADDWIPARPGSEGIIALAIARHLVDQGRYQGRDRADWQAALSRFTPEYAAERSGVSAQKLVRLAERFTEAPAPLAIGGGSAANAANGTANLVAVNVLNYLAHSIGREGGVLLNPPPPFGAAPAERFATYEHMTQLAEDARAGRIEVLIVHEANPVFSLPEAAGFRQAMENIPLVVALSGFMDETTALADIVLPTHASLESWGDDVPEPGVGFPVATLSQPVVKPLYDTRQPGDVVLALAERMNLGFPWADMRDYIRDSWQEIHARHGDEIRAMSFEEFWEEALKSGVWGLSNAAAAQEVPGLQPAVLDEFDFAPEYPANGGEFPYSLQPYMKQAWRDGRGSGLPWLQELHDPITGIAYGTWVELNPETAAAIDVTEGDVVEVVSTQGSVKAPVFVIPAIRPDVVGIPLGQGHTEYGRYARGRGANPAGILEPVVDRVSGGLAWTATRVSLRKTGERARLIKKSGVPRQLGRGILGKSG